MEQHYIMLFGLFVTAAGTAWYNQEVQNPVLAAVGIPGGDLLGEHRRQPCELLAVDRPAGGWSRHAHRRVQPPAVAATARELDGFHRVHADVDADRGIV